VNSFYGVFMPLARWSIFAILFVVGCQPPAETPHPEACDTPPSRTAGADWPRFLGPTSDGASAETGILKEWPRSGLKVVWEAALGLGFAPPVIADGRCFHFDRFGENCRLTARTSETGKLLWKYEYPTTYDDSYGYSPGPRCSPVVDGDRVYAYGPDGVLICVEAKTGKKVWDLEVSKKYNVHQNFFGVGSSPWVENELLIVAVGGSTGDRPENILEAKGNGSGIVAFDKRTGKEVWKCSDELASYASVIVAEIDGQRVGLYFARGGLLAFDPKEGRVLDRVDWRARTLESVNASNPVVVGKQILITECYGKGSLLLSWNGKTFDKVRADRDDVRIKSLACHWNTPIVVDGYAYGSSGRHENEAELRCVKWDTGEVVWAKKGLSRCQFSRVDGHFVCLTERGELSLLKIDPKEYREVARYELDGIEYPAWAAPVLSHGLLYIRGKDRLVCLELIPAK